MVPITWTSFTATPIFGMAAIRFPPSGSIGEIEIPLHLTKLSAQNEGSQITEVSSGPILDQISNLGSGGLSVSYGANQLSKISMEGWIDTPMSTSFIGGTTAGALYPALSLYPSSKLYPGAGSYTPPSEVNLPGIIIDGNAVTYTEIIAAYFEGRTSTNSIGAWQMIFPRWFRDSYGRVYGDRTPTGSKGVVRIVDFTAQRIETVPGRTNFTMTLQVA